MSSVYEKYEPVIGLEIHAQLLTNSKAFSSDSAAYGAAPNEHVSVISLGYPGTLPMHNKTAIKFAVKMGIACGCEIRQYNYYARKNYFYADLPKGYQITQDKTPICTGGKIEISMPDGSKKDIRLTRIHLEEDAGKSMHDQDLYDTLIDFNRAGVPLIEIVSEPDICSAEEAYQYITKIRWLLRYLEICDGNMEEGSLRCDANVSVRLKGETKFGVKVEVKNMNSTSNVKRAIEYEIIRQIDIIEAGEIVESDTRAFNALNGTTFSMRSKELANDYRYFPEPDLPPFYTSKFISDVELEFTKDPLPWELYERFTQALQLSEYDSKLLIDNKDIAHYFNEVSYNTEHYKTAANFMLGSVKSYLNENAVSINEYPINPGQLADLVNYTESGAISYSIATQKLLPLLLKNPSLSAQYLAETNNLVLEKDSDLIRQFAQEVLAAYPDKVLAYKNGKIGLLGMFVGEIMKKSKGKADPKETNKILLELLS
jgi:aspartyl-tRNA(Asn)/glutamyl-tRNA(Gln) amidotransferase subunit B